MKMTFSSVFRYKSYDRPALFLVTIISRMSRNVCSGWQLYYSMCHYVPILKCPMKITLKKYFLDPSVNFLPPEFLLEQNDSLND